MIADVGQYMAQGQASDFVVVCLDMVMKRVAQKHPRLFSHEHVDVVERFYTEKRPMSCLLSLEVLLSLAKTRPELVRGKKKKYVEVAKELDLPDDQMKKFNVFKD